MVLKQPKRLRLLRKELAHTLQPLDFELAPDDKYYFVRKRGPIWDVTFFQQTRSNAGFYFAYGLQCPELVPQGHSPYGLGVTEFNYSHRLADGEAFPCATEADIASSAQRVATLLKEKLPWFDSCSTVQQFEALRKIR